MCFCVHRVSQIWNSSNFKKMYRSYNLDTQYTHFTQHTHTHQKSSLSNRVNENLKICLKTDTLLHAYVIICMVTKTSYFWYGCINTIIIYTICECMTRLEMEERWRLHTTRKQRGNALLSIYLLLYRYQPTFLKYLQCIDVSSTWICPIELTALNLWGKVIHLVLHKNS